MLKLVADISTNYTFDGIAPAAAFTSFFHQRLNGKREFHVPRIVMQTGNANYSSSQEGRVPSVFRA
jgi:hypothetical protein